MSRDAQELANELYERFGALTKECALKIAAVDRLPITPIPREAVKRAVEQAAARLLSEYPFTVETAAGWDAFLRRKKSFEWAFEKAADAAPQAQEKPQAVGKADYIIEEKAKNAAAPLASNAEKEEAQPDREALRQYIDMRFTLYAQEETQDGKRKFRDWQGEREWNKDNSKIATLEELEIALRGGIALFAFFPSEKGFVCFDIDVGHSSGKDGFKSIERFLKKRGLAVNPFELASVKVDTPSGGKHLYFIDWTGTSKYDKEPLKGVEVFGKGLGTPLTAAGSVKKGKVYVLHGKLEEAAPLPNALLPYIRGKKERAAQPQAREAAWRPSSPTRSYMPPNPKTAEARRRWPLSQLIEWGLDNAKRAGYSGSRNWQARFIGLSVGRAYSLHETMAEIQAAGVFPDRRDFSDAELSDALERGMRYSDFQ